MTARTQVTLEPKLQRRARKWATDLGISLADYLRRLVSRDLGTPSATADVSAIFDLGSSGGSNIAKDKAAMIAEAFVAPAKTRRT